MDLEVARRPVGRRRTWPIALLVSATAAIVAVGALWPETAPDAIDAPGPETAATAPIDAVPSPGEPRPSASAIVWRPPPAAASEPIRRSRAWPASVEPVCRDIEPTSCERIASAALGLILDAERAGASRVVSLTVWRSLICGDSLDCPPARLAGTSSLGSAVVRFAGSTGALWVNVVSEPATDSEPAADSATTDAGGGPADAETTVAWPVRWAP